MSRRIYNENMKSFAKRLTDLLLDKEMTQSDLARAAFNNVRTDPRTGYEIVGGRDLVSKYCRAESLPEPKTLTKIAKALGVTPEYLLPVDPVRQSAITPSPLEISHNFGKKTALLKVEMTIPSDIAFEIGKMLSPYL